MSVYTSNYIKENNPGILDSEDENVWHDVNGDGYITADDFASWIREMAKLFPDMTEEQRKTLEAKHGRV